MRRAIARGRLHTRLKSARRAVISTLCRLKKLQGVRIIARLNCTRIVKKIILSLITKRIINSFIEKIGFIFEIKTLFIFDVMTFFEVLHKSSQF